MCFFLFLLRESRWSFDFWVVHLRFVTDWAAESVLCSEGHTTGIKCPKRRSDHWGLSSGVYKCAKLNLWRSYLYIFCMEVYNLTWWSIRKRQRVIKVITHPLETRNVLRKLVDYQVAVRMSHYGSMWIMWLTFPTLTEFFLVSNTYWQMNLSGRN